MAKVYRRKDSAIWWADYLTADGLRKRVSTGATNKPDAETILQTLLVAEKLGAQKRLTESRARGLIAEILERTTGETVSFYTVKEWFDSWLAGKKIAKAPATLLRYEVAARKFLKGLGKRAESNIETLKDADILEFWNAEREAGKTVRTANMSVKVVATCLNAAARRGILSKSPAASFEAPELNDSKKKEAFTPEETKKLIETASGDWRGVIMVGFYTGLRLQDCANLCWREIDFESHVLRVVPRKTARRKGAAENGVVIPMHPELEAFILSLPASDEPEAPVFPSLSGMSSSGRSGLSMAFSRLMNRAGVTSAVLREGSKAGRTIRAKSFHSFRHAFLSIMQNKGVSAEIRKQLAGHSDIAMTQIYSHVELETLRGAVAVLPSLGIEKPANQKRKG
jgi:integrase